MSRAAPDTDAEAEFYIRAIEHAFWMDLESRVDERPTQIGCFALADTMN